MAYADVTGSTEAAPLVDPSEEGIQASRAIAAAETGIQARDGRDVGSETRRCNLAIGLWLPCPRCGCGQSMRMRVWVADQPFICRVCTAVPAGPSVSVRCWSTCLLRMYVQYYVVVRGCRNGSILASLLSTPCPLCPRRGVRRHGMAWDDKT